MPGGGRGVSIVAMTFLRSSLVAAAIATLVVSGIAVAGSSTDSPKARAAAAKKRGPRGKTGPAGPKGPVGPVGPAGPKGADGAPGARGADGVAGPKGADGAAGAPGLAGATGPTGPQGDQGAQGVQGPQGVPGPQGPIGPSNAYTLLKHSAFGLNETPEGTWKDIASIENVPAGKYVVQGTLSAVKRGGGTLIRCQLIAPGHHTPLQAVAVGETAGASFVNTIQLMMPVSLNSAFTLTLQCRKESTNEPDKATYVENVQMSAIKVAALDQRY